MKKKYKTPTISIEYFELTQSIASCATKIGFLSSDCVIKDPDATNHMKDLASIDFFNAGYCEVCPEGMDENDSICYHTNMNAAFNS